MKVFGLLLLILACGSSALAQAPASPQPKSQDGGVGVTTIAKGFEHPWGIQFLPDGSMLVSERPGRMRKVSQDGRISAPLEGVPKVFAHGQAGLLDVKLSPSLPRTERSILSMPNRVRVALASS